MSALHGLPGEKRGYVSNVNWVQGHKGQGIQLRDSVFSMDKSVGQFERTQPYTLDFWLKLPKKPYFDSTRPFGPSASILYNNGAIEGLGYELSMANNKLSYAITHNAPTMIGRAFIVSVPLRDGMRVEAESGRIINPDWRAREF